MAQTHSLISSRVPCLCVGVPFLFSNDRWDVDEEDLIGPIGTEKLCLALKVDPSDVVMLAMAYRFGSPKMCQWPQAGWRDACTKYHIASLGDLQTRLPEWRKELKENAAFFKQVYQW